jgi:hypothetical protein
MNAINTKRDTVKIDWANVFRVNAMRLPSLNGAGCGGRWLLSESNPPLKGLTGSRTITEGSSQKNWGQCELFRQNYRLAVGEESFMPAES